MYLVAYCDFETTVPNDSCLDPEDKNDCHILCNYFCLEELTNVSYLIRDQLSCANSTTIIQLKYCAIKVSE